jgi:hypothetical protein
MKSLENAELERTRNIHVTDEEYFENLSQAKSTFPSLSTAGSVIVEFPSGYPFGLFAGSDHHAGELP